MSRFTAPAPGLHATELNGVILPPVCFDSTDKAHPPHVFVIGDWGGISYTPGRAPVPADTHLRTVVEGVDDCAQQRVAQQMDLRARIRHVDYILNVGDNFYWGGVKAHCGSPPFDHTSTGQWETVFEDVYNASSLQGKQWLGVLGNHDYGGYRFTAGWDQAIGYTWVKPADAVLGRWMTPAQYWGTSVQYSTYSVDYYFVDTNFFDTSDPTLNQGHNICALETNTPEASCGEEGPKSVYDCPTWFAKLWDEQLLWLESHLGKSTADWQVVVTHFPPTFGKSDWLRLSHKYGIDLFVTGHEHSQVVVGPEAADNFLKPTAYIISGGGGGIMSESAPSMTGSDDQYGFMDVTIWATSIKIESISHGGHVRSTTYIHQRLPATTTSTSSTTETVTTSTTTSTRTTSSTTTTSATATVTATNTTTTTSATTTSSTSTTTQLPWRAKDFENVLIHSSPSWSSQQFVDLEHELLEEDLMEHMRRNSEYII